MVRLFKHIHLPVIAVLLLALSMVASCERKPLYLRGGGNISVDFSDFEIMLQVYWGINWQAEWQYNLDSLGYANLGYHKPDWIRANFYSLDKSVTPKKRTSYFFENFATESQNTVTLKTNNWNDMLFYTAGTEYILFQPANDYSFFNATTRTSAKSQYRSRETRGAPQRLFVDRNQPDELVGTPLEDLWVSDDPDDYEVITNPDGSLTYVYHINSILRPYTFIYLFQVMLLNNYDDKGIRVTGCDGMTADGVADGVELFTRRTFANQVSITTDEGAVYPLQAHRHLHLPDGTECEGDIFAARMLTWGLPDMTPLDYLNRAVTRARSDYYHTLGIGLKLRNGYIYNVEKDVSEQMEVHPTGGVITVVFDTKEIPDSIFEHKEPTPTGGGGFNASVKDWSNQINAEIEI